MWELCALAGVVAGSAWALLLSLLLGQPLLLVPLSTTGALCLYIAWLLLRRKMGLAHRHILVEGLGLSLIAVALVSYTFCTSPLRGMDIGMVGFALAMVGGRLGCFCAGCCFGCPMVPGLRWPPHCPAGQPPFRRLPIQLVEALLWLVLWAIGSIATWVAPRAKPGTAAHPVCTRPLCLGGLAGR